MASHMEMKEIKALPARPYQDLRDELRSGDLLFAAGDYLVSKTIQQFTASPWSHVGIIFRLDELDRMLLLESVEDLGIRLGPLSRYVTDYENGKPYKGRLIIARCDGVDAEIVSGLTAFGIDELGPPYSNEETACIMARIVLGIRKSERSRGYICSELVYECFSHAGKEFEHGDRSYIRPEDIWLDESVSLLGRIL